MPVNNRPAAQGLRSPEWLEALRLSAPEFQPRQGGLGLIEGALQQASTLQLHPRHRGLIEGPKPQALAPDLHQRLRGLLDTGQFGLRDPWLQIAPPSQAQQAPRWIATAWRFRTFHENIQLTPAQLQDGICKADGVARCLRAHYYGERATFQVANYIGSWAKNTQVRPPRDVDLHFVVPPDVYTRFQQRSGNRQSALLQEVKRVLEAKYTATDGMRGDCQVVMVPFQSFAVEVAPAVTLTNGRYWVCNTGSGGAYKEADPVAEIHHLNSVDAACSSNLRPVIRMLKTWQRTCNVEIKSFHLELLAAEFMSGSPWRNEGYFYFDWLMRDFFAFVYHRANQFIRAPGTNETMWLGHEWQSKASSAYFRAKKACDFEKDNMIVHAGDEWQKIFGDDVPMSL